MTEELKPDQGASQDKGTPPAGADQLIPQGNEELERLRKALEDQKKEIAGLNRKISEDEKALKQKELEKLEGIEREKAETELARAEKDRIIKENQELLRSRIVNQTLFDTGIPPEFAKRVSGQSEDEIKADVKEFKDFIDKLVKTQSEKIINEKLGGKHPVGGVSPGSKTITEAQFKAMNPKDHAAFFAAGGKIEG